MAGDDLLQRRHSLLANFPVIGHGRYPSLEHRQAIVASMPGTAPRGGSIPPSPTTG